MNIRKEIEARIIEDWGKNSCAMLLFCRLLEQLKPGATRYFPLHYLANLVQDQYRVKEVEDAARYLAGERIALLNLAFEMIGEDNNSRDIETDAVFKALEDGVLLDPDSGEEIEEFESKIFMYFRGTDRLQSLVQEG